MITDISFSVLGFDPVIVACSYISKFELVITPTLITEIKEILT